MMPLATISAAAEPKLALEQAAVEVDVVPVDDLVLDALEHLLVDGFHSSPLGGSQNRILRGRRFRPMAGARYEEDMRSDTEPRSALPYEGLRVLDFAGALAPHCGQILALFGADVVLIETAADRSLRRDVAWAAFNAGKRSLAVDLDDAADRGRLLELARTADVWIDTGSPFAELEPRRDAAQLVHASITPFGLDGPRAGWRDCELVAQAAGGLLYLSGSRDHPPAQVGIPVAIGMAGAQAACAVLLALAQRQRTGLGARIDVSRQESVANLLFTTQFMSWVAGQPARRGEAPVTIKGRRLTRKLLWRCADGYATWVLWTGPGLGPKNLLTFEWMRESGISDIEDLLELPWGEMSLGDVAPELMDRVNHCVGDFFASLTKAEIDRQALERRILLAAIHSPEDIVHDEQLRAREAFRSLELPEACGGKTVPIVGRVARSTAYPIEIGSRAPEHGELGDAAVAQWSSPRPAPDSPSAAGTLPLDGVRVLDLGWAVVSPVATKYLALFGADVVKIEVRSRPDPVRMTGPYPLGHPSFDGSTTFQSVNASKRSAGIDLDHPEGRALIHRLTREADIVCENFTPGTAARLGCDEASLRAVRPDLIMLSVSLQGQTGPGAPKPGLGNHLQAMSGIDHLTGFPDAPPGGPNQVLPDFIGPLIAVASLLAALEHRRKTGEGQYIDLAQLEAIMLYVQPALIEYALTGTSPERRGNSSPTAAPHGVYPVAGDDCWIAIAVEDDAAWRALRAKLPAELAARFAADMTTGERLGASERLDEAIAEWTRPQDGEALMTSLQNAGVAAYTVSSGMQLIADPQLAHRGHYVDVEHGKLGTQKVDAPSFRFDRLEPRITAGPRYAEHTGEFLQDWLGLDDDAISALVASGALVF
jgi:crotonobetainyl-CoA:carnitine CoA-transferase CaiB-like acyl-CoA transferase